MFCLCRRLTYLMESEKLTLIHLKNRFAKISRFARAHSDLNCSAANVLQKTVYQPYAYNTTTLPRLNYSHNKKLLLQSSVKRRRRRYNNNNFQFFFHFKSLILPGVRMQKATKIFWVALHQSLSGERDRKKS